jgi:hypothetical protein
MEKICPTLDSLTLKNDSDWMPDDWTLMVDSVTFIIGFLIRILPSVYMACKEYFKN